MLRQLQVKWVLVRLICAAAAMPGGIDYHRTGIGLTGDYFLIPGERDGISLCIFSGKIGAKQSVSGWVKTPIN